MTNDEKRLFLHEAGHYVIGKVLGINVTGINVTRKDNIIEAGVAFDESEVEKKLETMSDEELDAYFIKQCKKDVAGTIAGFYSENDKLPNEVVIYNEFKSKDYNKSDYDKFMINIEDIENNLNIKHEPVNIIKETMELINNYKDKIFKLFELIETKFNNSIGSFFITKQEIDKYI